MLRTVLLGLVALVVLTSVLADQVPLNLADPTRCRQAEGQCIGHEGWNLNELPNPNDTDHLVFETVHSLLQHWPNTRMRNGHNIVLGKIPKGTLLYHGRTTEDLPAGPDWVSMDPEHSYLFCRTLPIQFQPACWHLTLATTRTLKVIYFDGNSAAKFPYGSMDTQNLIAWGAVDGHEDILDELPRLQVLCEWGKDFGVDGFVRMEMNFEVMLCDFTAGVSVVSFANLVVSQWTIIPIAADSASFEVLNAASWHDRFPGETRIQLDLAGLVSFYDVQLAPSLVDIRAGQERWDHRVASISSEDLSAVKSRLEGILARPEGVSSEIDWQTLLHVIVDRYAGRLELTRHLLNETVSDANIIDIANKTQTQLESMLAPYLLVTATPTYPLDEGDLMWMTPIYELCATTHTFGMESMEAMTDSERLILQAIRGTSREICRVVTKMWAAGVYAGVDRSSKIIPEVGKVKHLWSTWGKDLNHLMEWLDWSVWVKCNPGCGPEEMCYLPTWPFFLPPNERPHPPSVDFRTMVSERIAKEVRHFVKPVYGDWHRPQPRCIQVGPDDI